MSANCAPTDLLLDVTSSAEAAPRKDAHKEDEGQQTVHIDRKVGGWLIFQIFDIKLPAQLHVFSKYGQVVLKKKRANTRQLDTPTDVSFIERWTCLLAT